MTVYIGFVGDYPERSKSINKLEKQILQHILGITRFNARFYTSFDHVYEKDHRRPAFSTVFVQPGHASQQLEYFKMMIDTKTLIQVQAGGSEIEASIKERVARLALPHRLEVEKLLMQFANAATPRYSKIAANWPWELVKGMEKPKRPTDRRYGYNW